MDKTKLTQEIYEAVVGGNTVRGRPKRTILYQNVHVLDKGQVKKTRNRDVSIITPSGIKREWYVQSLRKLFLYQTIMLYDL
jgi:hypothetical protein